MFCIMLGKHGGLMVSALDSRSHESHERFSWGHYVVFLGKTP